MALCLPVAGPGRPDTHVRLRIDARNKVFARIVLEDGLSLALEVGGRDTRALYTPTSVASASHRAWRVATSSSHCPPGVNQPTLMGEGYLAFYEHHIQGLSPLQNGTSHRHAGCGGHHPELKERLRRFQSEQTPRTAASSAKQTRGRRAITRNSCPVTLVADSRFFNNHGANVGNVAGQFAAVVQRWRA